MPWVDIIIPTFNRKNLLLERAIPSVLSQTYPRTRAIVVAHGCTDGTVTAVARLRSPRVQILWCKRSETYPPRADLHWLMGPTQPLNVGLSYVKGDWIGRMDDDDILVTDHVEKMLQFAGNYYEFVSGAHEADGGIVQPYVMKDGVRIGGCQTWLYRSYLKFFRYNPDSWRRSWNRNNDTDITDRMWRAGVRMGYTPRVHAILEPRPGETYIGSKAYINDPERYEETYGF